jgi:serine/threonine-protein phosphatase 2A regulatory subunit B''
MVKPADPLRITLADLLGCRQGGTIASMLTDVRGFWAHDNRENLLQDEEEAVEAPEESEQFSYSSQFLNKIWYWPLTSNN